MIDKIFKHTFNIFNKLSYFFELFPWMVKPLIIVLFVYLYFHTKYNLMNMAILVVFLSFGHLKLEDGKGGKGLIFMSMFGFPFLGFLHIFLS